MKMPRTPDMLISLLGLLLLGGCAGGVVKLADKDTTGVYDGKWAGVVQKPSASRVTLPGKWTSRCDWDPYNVSFIVEDGIITSPSREGTTPVSVEGDFRLEIEHTPGNMIGGVMAGNGNYTLVYSGNLAGEDPSGSFLTYLQSIGANGCSAPMSFERWCDKDSSPPLCN